MNVVRVESDEQIFATREVMLQLRPQCERLRGTAPRFRYAERSAHRFYVREGLAVIGYHFRTKL